MTPALTFAYPGRLDLNTGGYAYDRRVIAGLKDLGWTVGALSLGEGFPFPATEVKAEAERRLSSLPDGAMVVVDGLAFGVLDDWAGREAGRLRIVALVHHPLALETGLDAIQREGFRISERRALSFVSAIVVTSQMTARELVSRYGVEQDRVAVATPGTDPAPVSTRERQVLHILSIGTLTHRKGHDVLLAALKRVEDLEWNATIVGSRDLDPPTSAALARLVQELDLGHRVILAGEYADTCPLFADADIFALASRYEGYGMVFAEALSQGLPIVACHAGAVPDVVPDRAGILVPVDDVPAFAQALRRLICDRDLRRQCAEVARQASADLPGWDVTARIISTRLEALL